MNGRTISNVLIEHMKFNSLGHHTDKNKIQLSVERGGGLIFSVMIPQ